MASERVGQGEAQTSAPTLAPTAKEPNPMAKADSVFSTPQRTALKIVAGGGWPFTQDD